MEKMDLVRGLKFLRDSSIPVATLVKDRHNQIAKYMAEVKPEIKHRMMCGTYQRVRNCTCIIVINTC